jgi:preprotein translocase subunit SecA
MKADIPQEDAAPATAVQHTVRRPAPAPALHTNREEEFDTAELEGPNEYARQTESTTKTQPVRTIKIADRNQKVSVQYRDGRILRDVKFKKVEQEVKNGDCVVIE